MMQQKSSQVRKLIKSSPHKRPIETITNFLTSSAVSVLSFFTDEKKKPAEPTNKPKKPLIVEEPEFQLSFLQEGKKSKPSVVLFKDGKLCEEE